MNILQHQQIAGTPLSIIYQIDVYQYQWLRLKLRYGNNDNDWVIRSQTSYTRKSSETKCWWA